MTVIDTKTGKSASSELSSRVSFLCLIIRLFSNLKTPLSEMDLEIRCSQEEFNSCTDSFVLENRRAWGYPILVDYPLITNQ